MPSGRVHAAASAAVTVATIIAMPWLVRELGAFALTSPLGCVTGVLVSPDLDVDGGNESDFIIRRKLGCLPALLWRAFWTPYAKLVPHRSPVSHFPVLGTLVRVGYMTTPLLLTAWALNANLASLPPAVWLALRGWLTGLILVDALHAVMDALT